jgi:putative transposase
VKTLFIEPGSPWENGYVESFNGKIRDELLDRELEDSLWETKTLCGQWVKQYNTVRPHSALGYRPPAPEARAPPAFGELTFVTRCVRVEVASGWWARHPRGVPT